MQEKLPEEKELMQTRKSKSAILLLQTVIFNELPTCSVCGSVGQELSG